MKQQRFARRAAVAGVIGAVVLSAAGCGSSSDDATDDASSGKVLTRTLNVGVFPTLNGLPGFIAKNEGYFEAEGLKVNLMPVKSAAEATPQLQGGQLDIAQTDMTTAILAKSQNFPLVAVAPGTVGKKYPADQFAPGNIWISADSSIKSLADLTGKKFAVPAVKTQVWLDVRSSVDAAGGDSSKIDFVETPDTAGGIKAGNVDAGTTSEPTGTTLKSDPGLKWLSNYTTADGGLAYMFVSGTKLFKESPATLAAFERAILKANAAANASQDLKVKVATSVMTTADPAALAKAVYPTYDEDPIEAADITKASDRMVKYDLLEKSATPDPADLIAKLD